MAMECAICGNELTAIFRLDDSNIIVCQRCLGEIKRVGATVVRGGHGDATKYLQEMKEK